MSRIFFSLLLIMGVSACSATLKEDKFIAQSEKIKPYNETMLASWQDKFPEHQINTISILSKDNNSQLHGVHLDNDNSNTVIFLIQGNGMEVEKGGISMLTALAKLETDIVIFDRRGLGASSGKATIKNLIADANQQYQFIENELSTDKIIVHGLLSR